MLFALQVPFYILQIFCISFGSGERNTSFSLVNGCMNEILYACNACLEISEDEVP